MESASQCGAFTGLRFVLKPVFGAFEPNLMVSVAPEALQDGRADEPRSFRGSEIEGAKQGRRGRDLRLWSLEQILSCLNPQPLGICAFQDDFQSPGSASVPEGTYSPNQSRPLCPWEQLLVY